MRNTCLAFYIVLLFDIEKYIMLQLHLHKLYATMRTDYIELEFVFILMSSILCINGFLLKWEVPS